MSRKKRLRWPWWVGGIIVVVAVSAYVDFKYVFPPLIATTENSLVPGATGTVDAYETACYPSSKDAASFENAYFRHDTDGMHEAIKKARFLHHGDMAQGIAYDGYLDQQLEIRVLDGALEGDECWIHSNSQFANIGFPGTVTSTNDASSVVETCVDEKDVAKIVDDLRQVDDTKSPRARAVLLGTVHRLIDEVNDKADCGGGAVPDTFLLATAWATAEDIRADSGADQADACKRDVDRDALASAWMTLYDQQAASDPREVSAAFSAMRVAASTLSLTLPPLSVDERGAGRFVSDQHARIDARSMGLPC